MAIKVPEVFYECVACDGEGWNEDTGETCNACGGAGSWPIGDPGGNEVGTDEEDVMDATKYQQLAARTLIDRPDFEVAAHDIMIVWNALGLAGEAGEVAELIKKGVFHQHGVDREKLAKELGDVLWYVAALCTKLGLSMGDVMEANIAKLRARYPNGYTAADSQARIDTIK